MKASDRSKKQLKRPLHETAKLNGNGTVIETPLHLVETVGSEAAPAEQGASFAVPSLLLPAEAANEVTSNPKLAAEYQASVLAATQGSIEAFEQLYNSHVDQIHRYIYYRVNNQTEAEDLVGQVFLQAWSSISNYKPNGSPFVAWLYTIAHNLVVNYYKKSERQAKLQMPLGDWVADVQGPDDPYRELSQKMRNEALRRAIIKLGQEQQQVIYLRYIEDYSHQQIAAVLGKSEAAVRVIQFRAQKALRQLLEQDGWVENSN